MGNKNNFIHGYTRTRLYNTWLNMKQRCLNKNNPHYKYYGGKGVKLCTEWKNDFICFKNWALSNGYEEALTIDRIEVNGNYEPSNCRWITNKKQQNNKTNNRYITYEEETRTLGEWAEQLGFEYKTLQKRIDMGWGTEVAFKLPLQNDRRGYKHES